MILLYPGSIGLLKVKNRNTRARDEICSDLTISYDKAVKGTGDLVRKIEDKMTS